MKTRDSGNFLLKTRVGHSVILYDISAGGDRPITGAYLAQDRWIPTSWDIRGRHQISEQKSNLDIVGPELWPLYERMTNERKWESILGTL